MIARRVEKLGSRSGFRLLAQISREIGPRVTRRGSGGVGGGGGGGGSSGDDDVVVQISRPRTSRLPQHTTTHATLEKSAPF